MSTCHLQTFEFASGPVEHLSMADDDHQHRYQSSPLIGTSWEHVYPHSHHGTPAQESPGSNFAGPQVPMEPSAYSSSIQQRPVHQQLQPLIMPQWPSMLNSQSHSTLRPMFPQPVQPIQPITLGALHAPVSAVSSRSASTPRKTLTDLDRKRMCQYAEEHPRAKQTEMGAIFGVERSTVSKVLRQKEKYLLQHDGSRSPIKRVKGRSPDIEKALVVWAKNQERKGQHLTDDIIREKARAFASTTTSPENHQVLSASWIETFKLKNNLMGARSRSGSLAPDDAESASITASSAHTPRRSSPVSPQAIGSPSSIGLHSAKSQESLKTARADSYLDNGSNGLFHTHSTTSLNSALTDTAPSPFSPVPPSPPSPFFTPDSGTTPGPFVPTPLPNARQILPAIPNSNSQRPRKPNSPVLEQYAMGATSSEATTPKYFNSELLDSPMEEAPDPLINIDEAVKPGLPEDRPPTVIPADMMLPPPLPAHILAAEAQCDITPSRSNLCLRVTSAQDALRALETVHAFIEQQPNGYLDFQESVTIGKLMEKLRLQSRAKGSA